MFTLDILLIFFVGLVFGSFANVCIFRLPQDTGVIFGRSKCLNCKNKISWYDNIPLISFIILKGRCRNCDTKISYLYFFVEFLSGIYFVAIYLNFTNFFDFILLQIIFLIFVMIFFIDLKHSIIPDVLNFSLVFLGLVKNLIPNSEINFNFSFIQSLLGGLLGYLSIWLIIYLYKKFKNLEAMGYGDAKLMAAIGTFFGIKAIPFTLFFSSIMGLLIVLPSLIKKTKSLKAEIPFGPYMLTASVFYYFYGEKIYNILLI